MELEGWRLETVGEASLGENVLGDGSRSGCV